MKTVSFSLFFDKHKGHKTVIPARTITLNKLVDIYHSDYIKNATAAILAATDSEEKQRLKMALPFITPYVVCSYRNRENVTMYNAQLIALDFDGMTSESAQELKAKLTAHPSVLLAAISPRQKGVKALVHVAPRPDRGTQELTDKCGFMQLVNTFDLQTMPSNLYLDDHYNELKANAANLLHGLNLSDYSAYLDPAQFVLVQPFFIAYDSTLYSNPNAHPLVINWTPYTAPEPAAPVQRYVIEGMAQTRVHAYLLRAAEKLANELRATPEGNRHRSIIRCRNIFSWMHYAPELTDTVHDILHHAVCDMYGGLSRATAHNAIKSLNEARATAQDAQNAVIESIIQELNTAAA
jgi:hypothetical protein